MNATRPAQIARHVTVVLAGAASLSLTVAAGAYIVQQMADVQRGAPMTGPAAGEPAVRAESPSAAIQSAPRSVVVDAVRPVRFELPIGAVAQFREPAPEGPAGPGADNGDRVVSVPTPGRGGRVDLGEAYVGAYVDRARAGTTTVTLDTNLIAVLTPDPRGDEPGARPERGGDQRDPAFTRIRTEVDPGGVSLAVSDPALGEHGVRLDRRPAIANPDPDRSVRTA